MSERPQGLMDQTVYRTLYHYRPAYMIADGSKIFVDDFSFDPALHTDVWPVPAAAPEQPVTGAGQAEGGAGGASIVEVPAPKQPVTTL